jgi:hypothetical protein
MAVLHITVWSNSISISGWDNNKYIFRLWSMKPYSLVGVNKCLEEHIASIFRVKVSEVEGKRGGYVEREGEPSHTKHDHLPIRVRSGEWPREGQSERATLKRVEPKGS